ncbi:unnamed protein product [Ceutorhynchus assimilis]|uniref:Uncharacterized protein n=1 Tax=Ceutorhynchus assimilis TaxID=467358 RepID=A0A9N9MCT2_9CUCU|nr:unnamed protein product [Ceutorhynchus assimilis]
MERLLEYSRSGPKSGVGFFATIMSSTKFNIGLAGDEKRSTRVQKIQSGGHSDIFGINENQQSAATPQKRLNQPQSTIGSCFMENVREEPNVMPEAKFNGDVPLAKVEVEEVDVGSDENQIPKEVNGVEKKDEEIAKRVRVPPGGFCSRLW